MNERSVSPKTTRSAQRFDPVAFFCTAAQGRTISKHRKNTIIFSQGEAADAVFYIKKGKIKVTVVSKQGKEAGNAEIPGITNKTEVWKGQRWNNVAGGLVVTSVVLFVIGCVVVLSSWPTRTDGTPGEVLAPGKRINEPAPR